MFRFGIGAALSPVWSKELAGASVRKCRCTMRGPTALRYQQPHHAQRKLWLSVGSSLEQSSGPPNNLHTCQACASRQQARSLISPHTQRKASDSQGTLRWGAETRSDLEMCADFPCIKWRMSHQFSNRARNTSDLDARQGCVWVKSLPKGGAPRLHMNADAEHSLAHYTTQHRR